MGGIFGEDPGEGLRAVSINGTAVPVFSWTPQSIVAFLPQSASGDVSVRVRDHVSNVAQLTEWEGNFTYTGSAGGTLKEVVTFHLRFRTDIRKARDRIHEPPKEPTTGIDAAPGSAARVACEGTATDTIIGDLSVTATWFGSEPIPSMHFFGNGDSHRMAMTLGYQDDLGPCTETLVFSPGGSMLSAPLQLPLAPDDPPIFGISIPVEFDTSAAIKGDSRPKPLGPSSFFEISNVLLRWDSIAPKAGTAPDPDAAR
jgi:hypothetical protein